MFGDEYAANRSSLIRKSKQRIKEISSLLNRKRIKRNSEPASDETAGDQGEYKETERNTESDSFLTL